ncbi:FecR domain-containing protein [Methylobacillus gramineus]|uniref:FecR domain-containing protein n=1 Tax=Methylobacillus gramineus TaxID=755169 RepID=UPI001CFF8FF2|nr:FecR domain-containing protein [Methylobacillus gramineus]MCB5184762.1 FecR domain-containing protein [Methylobacillus gramineus]
MPKVLQAATEWYVRLHDTDVTAQDRMEFERWLALSSHHRESWASIQQVSGPFDGLDPSIGHAVLLPRGRQLGRRQVLKSIGLVFVLGGSGALVYRERPWQAMLADYSTGKGERGTWTLPDDTVIVLNTGTAIDTVYDAGHRVVVLIKGEIMVETGHPSGVLVPFQVQTRHGMVTALGTRFSVRDHGTHISVNVFEHAIRVNPAHNTAHESFIEAGQSARFDDGIVNEVTPLLPGADLWVKGILSVNDMPLSTFLEELGRYHNGVLRCDSAIASMPVSGAFPLDDLNAILASLQDTYHLRMEFFTRYWVTLKPA